MGWSGFLYAGGRIAALAFVLAGIVALAWIRAPARPLPAVAAPQVQLRQAGLAAPYFVDRFDTLDTETRWAASDGWSNGAWVENDFRRSQFALAPYGLAFTLAANPPGAAKPFASGEISTREAYLYGYFEARLRAPRGEGLVVGVFTFARPRGRASWDEIDMELLGRDPRRLELATHSDGRPRKKDILLPFAAADGFHSYGFEWRPDVVRWYVDNVLVHEAHGPVVERLNQPQRFMINLWNSRALHRWVGEIDPRQAPWTMVLACAAVAPAYEGRSLCTP